MSGQMLECARAEALFVSLIQRSDPYSAAAVREAVRRSVGRHGSRGCAALVAHEYGEHPDVAVGRMSWALDTVRGAFPTVAPDMIMRDPICRGTAILP